MIRHLIVRSDEDSKSCNWWSKVLHHFVIWQVPQQHCCWDTCQITKWSDNYKINLLTWEILQGITTWHTSNWILYRFEIWQVPQQHYCWDTDQITLRHDIRLIGYWNNPTQFDALLPLFDIVWLMAVMGYTSHVIWFMWYFNHSRVCMNEGCRWPGT